MKFHGIAMQGDFVCISVASYGSLPAAGTKGRVIYVEDEKSLYVDSGEDWNITGIDPTTLEAYSVLCAQIDDTPLSVALGENTILGRLDGNIVAISTAQLSTLVVSASTTETSAGIETEKFVTPLSLTGKVDPDGTLSTNSDKLVASQKATKTYADTKVAKSLYDEHSILYATTDDTPVALTVGASTIVGRKASGNIVALTGAETNVILGNTSYALSDAATITIDWNNGNIQYVTLGGNRILATPSNPREGTVYKIILIQDGSGNRTITWFTVSWASGTSPTLTTTGGKADIITLMYANSKYYGDCTKNF
jgi:hypothetical protein